MENKKEWQDIGGMNLLINEEHRFGTDAVLLENFAFALKKDRACDIGTGCGIIPVLMVKNSRAKSITAIEIQKEATELLKETIIKNNISNIDVLCEDAKNHSFFDEKIGAGNLDLVTCNPPYYKENSGGDYNKDERKTAREEQSLDVYDVCAFAKRYLKFGGRLCVCYKPHRLADLFDAMRKNTLEPKKVRFVQRNINDSPWLVLVEAKKGAKSFLNILPPLVMNSPEGQKEIIEIYGEIKQNAR